MSAKPKDRVKLGSLKFMQRATPAPSAPPPTAAPQPALNAAAPLSSPGGWAVSPSALAALRAAALPTVGTKRPRGLVVLPDDTSLRPAEGMSLASLPEGTAQGGASDVFIHGRRVFAGANEGLTSLATASRAATHFANDVTEEQMAAAFARKGLGEGSGRRARETPKPHAPKGGVVPRRLR